MSELTYTIDTYRPALWISRLGSKTETAREIVYDPMVFANFFLAIKDFVAGSWPQELNEKIAANPATRISHKELLEMMGDLSALNSYVSGEFVGILQESMVAFDYFNYDVKKFTDWCSGFYETLSREYERYNRGTSGLENAVVALKDLLGLTNLESDILFFALVMKYSPNMSSIFKVLAKKERMVHTNLIAQIFNTKISNIQSFIEDSILVQSSFLTFKQNRLPEVSYFWGDLLFSFSLNPVVEVGDIVSKCVAPLKAKVSGASVARLNDLDQELVQNLLKTKTLPSVNVLLYGDKSLDRESLVVSLAQMAKKKVYAITAKNAETDDYPSICMVAQHYLKTIPNSLLYVSKAQHALSRSGYHPALSFFGIEPSEDVGVKDFDDTLLAASGVKTIWAVSNPSLISEDSLSRFTYHVELKAASRSERKAEIEKLIADLKVSAETKMELVKLAGLSSRQIENAVGLASSVKGANQVKRETVLIHALTRSQKALNRREVEELRTPITTYSLEYLNTSGSFKPEQIINSLKRTNRGTLCFYGLPGTGKTQLAEHIALCLDRPIIMKRASELIDKYIGESEKNISKMFMEAAEEDAVLLLDEADSFLRDRTMARHSWEVSQVNELLQRMERFNGVFICATNLFSAIDSAALRRFTFKLEFLALEPKQRWDMFINEAGLRGFESTMDVDKMAMWRTRLDKIKWLTPGDFATVKRQCVLLGESLSPNEWLVQLELEAKAKSKDIKTDNDIKTPIGFGADIDE